MPALFEPVVAVAFAALQSVGSLRAPRLKRGRPPFADTRTRCQDSWEGILCTMQNGEKECAYCKRGPNPAFVCRADESASTTCLGRNEGERSNRGECEGKEKGVQPTSNKTALRVDLDFPDDATHH